MLTFADIEAARQRIGEAVYKSPCAYSETFSKLTGNRSKGLKGKAARGRGSGRSAKGRAKSKKR